MKNSEEAFNWRLAFILQLVVVILILFIAFFALFPTILRNYHENTTAMYKEYQNHINIVSKLTELIPQLAPTITPQELEHILSKDEISDRVWGRDNAAGTDGITFLFNENNQISQVLIDDLNKLKDYDTDMTGRVREKTLGEYGLRDVLLFGSPFTENIFSLSIIRRRIVFYFLLIGVCIFLYLIFELKSHKISHLLWAKNIIVTSLFLVNVDYFITHFFNFSELEDIYRTSGEISPAILMGGLEYIMSIPIFLVYMAILSFVIYLFISMRMNNVIKIKLK